MPLVINYIHLCASALLLASKQEAVVNPPARSRRGAWTKESHPCSSNPGFALGLAWVLLSGGIPWPFCWCLLLPNTFQAYSKQCFLTELIWLLIPSFHLYEMEGRQAQTFEEAGCQRETTLFCQRAEFGAGRPNFFNRNAYSALHVVGKLWQPCLTLSFSSLFCADWRGR